MPAIIGNPQKELTHKKVIMKMRFYLQTVDVGFTVAVLDCEGMLSSEMFYFFFFYLSQSSSSGG